MNCTVKCIIFYPSPTER